MEKTEKYRVDYIGEWTGPAGLSFPPAPNWQAKMGDGSFCYEVHLSRGPNALARFMWRVFFNVHWSRIATDNTSR